MHRHKKTSETDDLRRKTLLNHVPGETLKTSTSTCRQKKGTKRTAASPAKPAVNVSTTSAAPHPLPPLFLLLPSRRGSRGGRRPRSVHGVHQVSNLPHPLGLKRSTPGEVKQGQELVQGLLAPPMPRMDCLLRLHHLLLLLRLLLLLPLVLQSALKEEGESCRVQPPRRPTTGPSAPRKALQLRLELPPRVSHAAQPPQAVALAASAGEVASVPVGRSASRGPLPLAPRAAPPPSSTAAQSCGGGPLRGPLRPTASRVATEHAVDAVAALLRLRGRHQHGTPCQQLGSGFVHALFTATTKRVTSLNTTSGGGEEGGWVGGWWWGGREGGREVGGWVGGGGEGGRGGKEEYLCARPPKLPLSCPEDTTHGS